MCLYPVLTCISSVSMLVSSTLYSVFLSCWCWSDSESLPSLEVLQNGLLNTNDEDVEEVVTLYLHLLRFALDDLGVPNPRSVSSFFVCLSASIQLLFPSVCLQVFIFSSHLSVYLQVFIFSSHLSVCLQVFIFSSLIFAAHSCCVNTWKSSNPALSVVSLPICLSVGHLAIRLFQIKALKHVNTWKSSNPDLRVVSLPICLSVGHLAVRLFQIKALKQVQKCAKQQYCSIGKMI